MTNIAIITANISVIMSKDGDFNDEGGNLANKVGNFDKLHEKKNNKF